ncbi:MAG: Cna B-type domain-containing protein [Clostridiales bacterium]|nr:Cna B-type domain-containing protein [Clostridiales bacterium]
MKRTWARVLSLILVILLCVSTFSVISVYAEKDDTEITADSDDEEEAEEIEEEEEEASGEEDLYVYAESESEEEASYSVDEVQAMIDALPTVDELDEMDSEELLEAYYQLEEVYAAYETLSEEDQASIDDSVFDELFDYFNNMTATAEDEFGTTYEVGSVTALKNALASAVDGDTIILTNDITVAYNKSASKSDFNSKGYAFAISSGITLDLNEHTISVDYASGSTNYALFGLYTSESVTIKNGILDGQESQRCTVIANYRSSTTWSTENTLTLESLTIKNFNKGNGVTSNTHFKQSLIYLNGATFLSLKDCLITENGYTAFYFTGTEDSSVTIEDSTISENYTNSTTGGGFYITKTSSVNISGNTISGNGGVGTSLTGGGFHIASCDLVEITNNTITQNEAPGSTKGLGGGFYLTGNGDTTISGNTISKNESGKSGGGGYIINTNGDLIITDNTISENTSNGYGGGLYINNSSSNMFGEVKITENIISGNIVGLGAKESGDSYATSYCSKGGGIAFYDNATSHDVTSAYDFSGNIITNNSTALNASTSYQSRGGGLSLYGMDASREFLIESGTITGNSADWGGGIDYTYHCASVLHLYNAIITDNTADSGGGFWSCPSSTTTMYVTLGGTIYKNTATSMADSIRFEEAGGSYSGSGGVFATVAPRALGGTLMDWYSDEADARYTSGDSTVDLADYTNRTTSFSLHGELSEAGIALATAEAALLITGNSATQVGGGIASNAGVVFGENEDVSFTVTKEWKTTDGEEADSDVIPESITVQLIRVDDEENEVYLESVELSEDNNWTYTFEDLPGNYTYKIAEISVDSSEVEFTVSYSDITTDDDGNYYVTVTNSYEPTEPDDDDDDDDPSSDNVTYTVKKVWSGDDEDERPESITVTLYRDGKAYKTVTLSEDNNWKYTWTALTSGHTWTVEEVDVPDGYTSTVSKSGKTYTVTNTYEEPEDTTETEIPEDTTPEDTTPEDTTEAETPEDSTPEESSEDTPAQQLYVIPKTGDSANIMLWVVIMAIAVGGIVFVLRYGRKKK